MKITKRAVASVTIIVIIISLILGLVFGIKVTHIYGQIVNMLRKSFGLIFSIYIFFLGLVIFLENKNPAKTISWLLVLALIPGLGFILYLFLGQNIRKKYKFKKKKYNDFKHLEEIVDIEKEYLKQSRPFSDSESNVKNRLINLLLRNSESPFTVNNKCKVLTNGNNTFDAIIKELKSAKHHIHMEYYIIKDDDIGNRIRKILIDKAKKGVEVRVIYDSVGCWKLSRRYIKTLKNAGVEIHSFLPVFLPVLSRELNYRNHRKILIVDGRTGFLGGLNIGDEYLGRDKKIGFWRDTHLKIEGEGTYFLQNIFLKDWEFVSKKYVSGREYYPELGYYGEELIQLTYSGPDSHWQSIMQAYFTMISNAEKKIWITTPYLVPGSSITTALISAALSGVDVRIIIPSKPDHLLVHWASMGNVEELLKAGVKVYKYENGFIHSKVLLVDEVAASVGSANLDIRSLEINFEVNSFIYDNEIINKLERDFKNDIKNSTKIKLEEYEQRSVFCKFKESIGRVFSPLL
ncbi:cardiolipin synthase [Dethiothermospora halolimnae]|uniref:cardiolipin synthase n=1 Tax=Dethiothermospora halolimnae TaxID=3114390 RepID=UPI003CCC28EF